MEQRLVPINALIGLVTPGDLNRPALLDAGYRLAGLEIPIITTEGLVVLDAVLANGTTGHLLAAEVKSGANVEVAQARRYAVLDPRAVAQLSFVDLRTEPNVEPLYVCLAEYTERILQGLHAAGMTFPVLAIDRDKISLETAENASPALRHVFAKPVALQVPPPRFVAFDHDSPMDVVQRSVKAALVALLARRVHQVSLASLTEEAAPHFGLYPAKAQGEMVRKVQGAARLIAEAEPSFFVFHPRSGNKDGLVQFLRTPEDNDPRGRTQGYQALARGGETRRRKARPVDPDQLDLLAVLDAPDESTDAVGSPEEDEGTEDPGVMP